MMDRWIDDRIAYLDEKIGKLEECLCKAYAMLEELEELKRRQAKSPLS